MNKTQTADRIKIVAACFPNLRLGQLILNATFPRTFHDIYEMSDVELVTALESYAKDFADASYLGLL